jgi:hypothetical protein
MRTFAHSQGNAVDGNGDGIVSFGDPADTNLVFWVNDDRDRQHTNEGMEQEDDLNTGTPDCQDAVVNSRRDLEDFARLHVKMNGTFGGAPCCQSPRPAPQVSANCRASLSIRLTC